MNSGRQVWNILNPVSVIRVPVRHAALERFGTGRAIGFLSNRKPGTDELQHIVGARLEESGYTTRYYQKTGAATPAKEALIERIVEECNLVVTGTGD